MKKVIKLTESDLARIVRRVIKEQTQQLSQTNTVIPQKIKDQILKNKTTSYQGYDPENPTYYFISVPRDTGRIDVKYYGIILAPGNKGFSFGFKGESPLRLERSGWVQGEFNSGGFTVPGDIKQQFADLPENINVNLLMNYFKENETGSKKMTGFKEALDFMRQFSTTIADNNLKMIYSKLRTS